MMPPPAARYALFHFARRFLFLTHDAQPEQISPPSPLLARDATRLPDDFVFTRYTRYFSCFLYAHMFFTRTQQVLLPRHYFFCFSFRPSFFLLLVAF